MPNIEIHGYNRVAANALADKIFGEVFAGKLGLENMVVTMVPSTVMDKKGFQQPFIRLLCSNTREAAEIIAILRQHLPGEDIEYVKIESFIPGRKT